MGKNVRLIHRFPRIRLEDPFSWLRKKTSLCNVTFHKINLFTFHPILSYVIRRIIWDQSMQPHKRRINFTYWPIPKTLHMIILKKFVSSSFILQRGFLICSNTCLCLYSNIIDYISGSDEISFNMLPVEAWYVFSFSS